MGYHTQGFTISVNLGKLLIDTGTISPSDVIELFAKYEERIVDQLKEMSDACEAFDETALTPRQRKDATFLQDRHGYSFIKLAGRKLLEEVEFQGCLLPNGHVSWRLGVDTLLGDDGSVELPEEGTWPEKLLACMTLILDAK